MELKTQTGRLSPRQEVVFDDLGEQGFPVHILRSKEDDEDFINGNDLGEIVDISCKSVSFVDFA